MISSCSHCGVINAIRTAMAISGVDKLHAVLGGFHLGVASPDYVEHTMRLRGLRFESKKEALGQLAQRS